MNDWTYGYVADIGYTFGYYNELNPLRQRLAFLHAGFHPPEIGAACELGFGQGLSINIHAAASPISWWGTDFNPSQASFAQSLSEASGASAKLFDQSFSEFCHRPDLPDFDFIGVHGIWSWISEENRKEMVDFFRRKLKVGGVLYISYNTQPGWAAMVPMRHLLTEHCEVMGSPGRGIISRIDAAIEFAEKLLATNPTYAKANPQVPERIKKIKEQNRHYLAHEYFNRDWFPMHFAEMAACLSPAKLNFACSAHYIDHVEGVNLTPDQQKFLREIPDAPFRETVRDFMINQQFRRDYWVKGARRMSPLEQIEALRKQSLILMTPRADVSLKVTGSLGEANMSDTVYNPILDILADNKPKTVAQIEQAVKESVVTTQVLQAMMVLVGKGDVAAVQEEKVISKFKAHSEKLNLHLMHKARGNSDINYLASPVTGGGVTANRFQQLFLLAKKQGKKTPEEWAAFVWQILNAQGQKLIREGKTLETAEENQAEITAQAKEFNEKRLPVFKILQIA